MVSRSSRSVLRSFVFVLAAASLTACLPSFDEVPHDSAEGLEFLSEAAVMEHRRKKDERFREPNSVWPEDRRDEFQGLLYFPMDESLRFIVKLERYEDPDHLVMITTEGEKRPAIRYGYLAFEWGGKKHSLQVYQLQDMPAEARGQLFVPFQDTTSGMETYPTGRYLELAGGEHGWYVLDFNLAYNPSCAYGKKGFACPVTPAENRLTIPVRAGEYGWVHPEGGYGPNKGEDA